MTENLADSTTLHKTVFLAASREVVWAYLTDKDRLGEWFHPGVDSLEAGKPYQLYKSDDRTSIMLRGDILVADRPSFLSYTGTVKPIGDLLTRLSWTLDEVPGGTRLSLLQEGVGEAAGDAALAALIKLDNGWDKHFSDLRRITETGVSS